MIHPASCVFTSSRISPGVAGVNSKSAVSPGPVRSQAGRADADFGAPWHPDERAWDVQLPPDLGEGERGHTWAAVLFGLQQARTHLEMQSEHPVLESPGRAPVVVGGNALGVAEGRLGRVARRRGTSRRESTEESEQDRGTRPHADPLGSVEPLRFPNGSSHASRRHEHTTIDGRGGTWQASLWRPSPDSLYVGESTLRLFPFSRQVPLSRLFRCTVRRPSDRASLTPAPPSCTRVLEAEGV